MNRLHLTHQGGDSVSLLWQRGTEVPRVWPHPLPFTNPLTPEDRRELRWYLEEYLTFPYGAERDRAAGVEARMARWGEALFAQLFPAADAQPDPQAFYQEAVRDGLDRCELCISSEDPAFLSLPWELVRDPTPGRGYLAPSLAGLYRQRTGQKIESPLAVAGSGSFRVLLVTARPYGRNDVDYCIVARPVLEALRALRPRVQIDLLRPPTFDALARLLTERRDYYHLVHFDGHGVFARPSQLTGALALFGGGRGHLVFEKEDGSEHIVSSDELGQALATARVPLFVLNACQSAQEESGADPYSSVAAQLVATGAKGVVAMTYSVYATTAADFMQRFYERLVQGAPLSEAVAAARLRLYTAPDRAFVIGPLPLRDWIVPALYQQELSYLPIPAGAAAPTEGEQEDEARRRQVEEACAEGPFGFIGRDYDLLRIERALRQDDTPWALLTGIGGVGKTTLACGFGRWYWETGGCPGGVFVTSFKEKADFGQVIGSIVGYGTDFSRLPADQQWDQLVGYLRQNPCLLIWDNFETVAGYPEGSAPLATDEERAHLSNFLRALRGGRTRVLLTTRKPDENWLNIATQLLEIPGLIRHDAALLARKILPTVDRKPDDFRNDPNYTHLLNLLNGHPRSYELVLTLLRHHPPAAIIEALQHRTDALGESLEDASLSYAFSHLSERAQWHLPFLGLFAARVQTGVLAVFAAQDSAPQKAYADLMGEALNEEGWEDVLAEGARCGLLQSVNRGLYSLHPTLGPFLRRRLAVNIGEDSARRLDAVFVDLYTAVGQWLYQNLFKADPQAVTIAVMEEPNFLRSLQSALTTDQWASAHSAVQALTELYKATGRPEEQAALLTDTLSRLGVPDAANVGQADLWIYLSAENASVAFYRCNLEAAEHSYTQILAFVEGRDDLYAQKRRAGAYHALGVIAHQRGQFDEAEAWLLRSLEVSEALSSERDIATSYHHLGMTAQFRGRLAVAEEWLLKAREIVERLDLERDAAAVYHHLGMVAQLRNQLEAAEGWFHKSLAIFARLGLEQGAAGDYHHLGMIAELQGKLVAAEAWFRQALAVFERLGPQQSVAEGYHHLGAIALERSQLEASEAWHRKALAIKERLDLEREAAPDYHTLGTIALLRGRPEAAEQWFRKALEIYERFGRPPLYINTVCALVLLAADGGQLASTLALLRSALAVAVERDLPIDGNILPTMRYAIAAFGEPTFTAAWREAFPDREDLLQLALAAPRPPDPGAEPA